tara:strand:- start:86 stop:454 length:369 start_codon:yes stop_codon:yes gene_type:complete
MSTDYRKLYTKETGKSIPNGYEIHHVDANRENNKMENLIALPINFHKTLHLHIGLLPKETLEELLNLYNKTNKNFTTQALVNWIFIRLKKINVSKEIMRRNKIHIGHRKLCYWLNYQNNGFY